MSRLSRLLRRGVPPAVVHRLNLAPEVEKHAQSLFRAMDLAIRAASVDNKDGMVIASAAVKACAMLGAMYASLSQQAATPEGRAVLSSAVSGCFEDHMLAFFQARARGAMPGVQPVTEGTDAEHVKAPVPSPAPPPVAPS